VYRYAPIIRLMLSLTLLAASTVVLVATPGLLRAQTEEEQPCEFGGPGEWHCIPNVKHIYQSSCEGIDCYDQMETCC